MPKQSASARTQVLRPDMTVREITTLCPEAGDIMLQYGMHCFDCSVGGSETLTEAGRIHQFDDETVAALLEDINDAFAAAPERPQMLIVTDVAALAIRGIAASEGKAGQGLSVIVDDAGGFCMEFQEEQHPGDLCFTSQHQSDVRVFASPLTLARIGGATIDFRDGVFKLDLVDDQDVCECREHGACVCEIDNG